MYETQEPPAPLPIHSGRSANYQKYQQLLQGNYRNGEIVREFRRLFGEGYTIDDIKNNYTSIFDVSADEMDEAILQILTSPEFNFEENDMMMQGMTDTPSRTEEKAEEALARENAMEFPEHIVPPPPEVQIDEEGFPFPTDSLMDSIEGSFAEPSLSMENPAEFVPQGSNGFTDISVVSKTETSIRLKLWYRDNQSAYNLLSIYNPVSRSWSYLLGQEGKPSGRSGNFNVTKLQRGVVYRFIISTYDFASRSWKKQEIRVQTSGAKTPSLLVQESGYNFIILNATFPSEKVFGNELRYWDGKKWNDITGKGSYATSGTYRVDHLFPNQKQYFYLRHYNHMTDSWGPEIRVQAHTMLPPERLRMYRKSDIDFYMDEFLVNLFDPSRFERFLEKTNRAYAVIYGLVGGERPLDGRKMQIQCSRTMSEFAEGMAGEPIRWSTDTAARHILAMNEEQADITATPIHEISHNFDLPKWTFEPEALAYFKQYYYFAMTNEKMAVWTTATGRRSFTGREYKDYMKSHAKRMLGHVNYDASVAQGVYSPYGLAYNLADIADRIGWEPFKKTFDYFHKMSNGTVHSNIDKFNLFMTKLREFSGQDVLSMLTDQEKQVYESKLGGKIEYYMKWTLEDIYLMADYFIKQAEGESARAETFGLPLYDKHKRVIGYAVPVYIDNRYTGHINMGARKDGLMYYIVDKYPQNYHNLDQAYRRGSIVRYEPPYLYYEETNSSTSRGTNEDEREGFDFESTYSEAHLQNANHFIETLQNPSVEIQSQNTSGRHQQAMLTSERNKEYVKITNAGINSGYGGDQTYFKEGKRMLMYGLTPEQVFSTSCGPTALCDVIAYHALYRGQSNLLEYTDAQKYLLFKERLNPKYNKSKFNKFFIPTGKGFSRSEYTKFMDFYTEMVDYSFPFGWSDTMMGRGFGKVSHFTGTKIIKLQPISTYIPHVEKFIFDTLSKDIPVLMLNSFETADTKYLLNDSVQQNQILVLDQDFDHHWMTITKIFKDGRTGVTSIAFATWGARISMNAKLLQQNEVYYPTISAYTITQ
ncbi:MAG: hypothetical protein Q4A78_02105 [Peptostreptococcaceae bacterium]|nr:hypothetical protein [Peptostreptococcaceae bacterium]